MELMDKIDQMLMAMQQGIDSQSIALLLGILGIAITIFTVVYSFMESTKERKRLLFERVNADANAHEVDPVLRAELAFATQYLTELWKMNKSIMTIIVADIVILAVYVVHLIFKEVSWLWYVALALEVVLIGGCLYTLYVYLRQYYNRFVNIV